MTGPEPRMCANCEEPVGDTQMDCPFCDDPTETVSDVMCARWERQQEDYASEPPMTMREQHLAAWQQKQELHR